MNLKQAEAIASLYQELIASIDHAKIPLPKYNNGNFKWETSDISSVNLEEGNTISVRWERYRGCGETSTQETYLQLDELFAD